MAQIRHKINEYFSNHLKILYFRYLRMEYDKLREQAAVGSCRLIPGLGVTCR